MRLVQNLGHVIGLYLGFTSVGSFYGVPGSLVMVLLWIYYSLQAILLGAEFTKVYARRVGSRTKLESRVVYGSSDDLGH